jgi:hypothetical protein
VRWEDGVEEVVARLGCRNWKVAAANREGWMELLKEAEAHPGLWRRRRERECVCYHGNARMGLFCNVVELQIIVHFS